MRQISLVILAGVLLSPFTQCKQVTGNAFVPEVPGISGTGHTVTLLKRPLREISGIDYLNENKLVANNDEQGKLFFVDPATGAFEAAEFGPKDDYEDVVKAGDFYYVLNSKGHLFEITEKDNKLVASYTYDFGKNMEFESLCYDKANNQLILVCKECGHKANCINGYRFSLSDKQFIPGVYFSISWGDVRLMGKDNSIECKPSAATINPVNGKLYIIASVGKVLLQCSSTGILEGVYKLNPEYFTQPEGMTFTPAGDLYISNEGGEGKATILKFAHHL